MRIEYGDDIGIAHIYLVGEIKDGEAVKTIQLNNNIILDFDKNGRLLGVEALDASKTLNREILKNAQLAEY